MAAAIDPVFTDLPNSIIGQTRQICIVTRDLDACVRNYADRMGIGPWWVQEYAPPVLTDRHYRGGPGQFSMRLALAWTGDLNWEIIEPLEGPSIYHEFLEEHGEGLQHVGFLLQDTGLDWDACVADMEARGFARVMSGGWRGVRFCYFQTGRRTQDHPGADLPPRRLPAPGPALLVPAAGLVTGSLSSHDVGSVRGPPGGRCAYTGMDAFFARHA